MTTETRVAAPRPSARERPAAGSFAIVCALFFASGACGLIYQQLWLRQLSLVFGVTVYAVSTVLATFFGGLALGSFLAGRWLRRTRRPLHWYGVAEVIVAGLAIVTPAGLRAVERVYVAVAGVVPDSTPLLVAVRFTLSFAALIVPATLLGATLPLVVSSSAVRGARVAERMGVLYATNTAGAIFGALIAGFWMVGSLGITLSFRAAATVNAVVGVVAIAWARHAGGDAAEAAEPGEHVEPGEHAGAHGPAPERPTMSTSSRSQRVVLAVFAISGFVSIALEVVWFRVLVLYVESDTYAFTVMLAGVLAGIAIGGYLAAMVMRAWGARLLHLAVIEMLVGLAAVTSFAVLSKAFTVDGRYGDLLAGLGASVRFTIVTGALTVLPTAVLLGMAFPIGLSLWTGGEGGSGAGGRAGVFYAVNVAAGIGGSLVAGFVLVPVLGSRSSLIVLCAAFVASGLLLAGELPRGSTSRAVVAAAGVVGFLASAVWAVPDPYDATLRYRYPDEAVLWKREGLQTTVAIQERSDGTRVMYLDGLHQANSSPGMVAYHRLIGTLPLAVHADPHRALVIGLGGGVTPGALSDDPTLAVDIVELSSEVVEGATWLAAVNGGVTERPNVDVRVDDGRNYLLTTDERYDVITADLIQPHHAGAGKLWSVEYWRLAREALAPGGVMVQWVPADRERDHTLIVRSFLEVFPYVTAWAGGSMLVGSNEPQRIDPVAYDERLSEPGVGPALAAAGMGSVEELRAMFTAGRDELIAHVGDGPVLTDDRPRLEYWRSAASDRSLAPDLSALRGDPGEVIRS